MVIQCEKLGPNFFFFFPEVYLRKAEIESIQPKISGIYAYIYVYKTKRKRAGRQLKKLNE